MTLKEKIEIMKYYEQGGKVEMKGENRKDWQETTDPQWNWVYFEYRIKPKPVELLYEWWYKPSSSRHVLSPTLYDVETADNKFFNWEYGKTGRWFNPETKEFGGS